MNQRDYKKHVSRIPFGKRLRFTVYVYRGDVGHIGRRLGLFVDGLAKKHGISDAFNVIKFRLDKLKISFLSYPTFLVEAHPILQKAVAIDLVDGKRRYIDFIDTANPPILHRKETFLRPDHPKRPEFADLTKAEERAGLFNTNSTIGFQHNWERLLRAKGLTIRGHCLEAANPRIQRHMTARIRYDLSKPVKGLLRYRLINRESTFFDFGCGHGSDVRRLRTLGYTAEGWDPVFHPDQEIRKADVVNLGYVLNVIEDPVERINVLMSAYQLANRLLSVSVLTTATVNISRAIPYADGVLTRRKTFQKFFKQQEAKDYIERSLKTKAVAVSSGIFYIFKKHQDLEDFERNRKHIKSQIR